MEDQLKPHEEWWRDHYDFLRSKGYELRPRYQPGWTPSWLGTDKVILLCEDRVSTYVSGVMCLSETVLTSGPEQISHGRETGLGREAGVSETDRIRY